MEALQREWDRAKQHDDRLAAVRAGVAASRDARETEKRECETAAAAAQRKERDDRQMGELKARIRERYLRTPAATEADFDADWPALLAEHRRRAAGRGRLRRLHRRGPPGFVSRLPERVACQVPLSCYVF